MKRRLPAWKRDLTGLACAVGMGLLVVLAWTTLPRLPEGDDGLQDESPTELGSPFAAPSADADSSLPASQSQAVPASGEKH